MLLWRLATGAHPSGKPITNAGALRTASKPLTRSGHAAWYWHRPRLHRAGINWAGFTGSMLALYGLLTAPALTVTAMAVAWGTAIAAGVRLLVLRMRSRKFMVPLHLAAHEMAGHPRAMPARSWIDLDKERTRLVLWLTPGWPADENDKQRLVATATAKTGIPSPKPEWHLAGPKPRLMLTAGVPAPELVTMADLREAIERAKPDEIVLGKGRENVIVTASLRLDSPHWGVSAESGAGKSITCRTIMCQVAHKGGILAVLDAPKRFSHQWCKGLPNVAYARTPAEAHDLLLWLVRETERRNQVADVSSDLEGNVHAKFDRIMFVVEEANALASRLRRHWQVLGGGGRSPAIDALEELLFLGRQVRFNGLLVGQRLSVKATGSGDARENLGVKVLLNPSAATWKMLASRFAQPPPDNTKGRAQLVTDEVREVQVGKFTAVEAREYAMSGVVTPCPAGMPGTLPGTSPIPLGGGPDVGVVPRTAPHVLAPAGMVTLREATDFIPRSLDALQKASQRRGFPPHAGMRGMAREWDSLDLVDWHEGKRWSLEVADV